jgi:pilus assembly protein CpaC
MMVSARTVLGAFLMLNVMAVGAEPQPSTSTDRPDQTMTHEAEVAAIGRVPGVALKVGKSTLLRLAGPIERMSVGNPAVADVTLVSPREVYVLGKALGTTNLIVWRRQGGVSVMDLAVDLDASVLETRLRELFPDERSVVVRAAADAVVLSGTVASVERVDAMVQVAEAFVRTASRGLTLPIAAGDREVAPGQALSVGTVGSRSGENTTRNAALRVVNLLRVTSPQQVMLEVKVAEVSKTLLDRLGVGVNATRSRGDWRYSILTDLLSGSSGLLGVTRIDDAIRIDAERRDGLIRVLAEPNIVSISGQEASFLAGGKIFIPVSRNNSVTGVPTITLEEKEYGVGLKFTPTVLEGDRINLRVAPEVSELSQTGSPFTTVGGVTAILPSFTTRRAQTTVQLRDGQSFAIAGLIKNNLNETIKRFPVLGDLPILGALFRSSEFQTDRSELLFVVTPRLVKPLGTAPALPTDGLIPPNRSELFLKGQLEGSGHPEVPMSRASSVRGPGSSSSNASSRGRGEQE